MKLRHVFMQIRDTFDDFQDTFNYNVEFINWYLSKAIRKLSIEIPYECNAIGICPTLIRNGRCAIIPVNCLSVEIVMSEEEKQMYLGLTHLRDKFEFYLSLFERGYRIANESFDIPINTLLSLHEQFRRNNYRTEWDFKKDYIKESGINVIFRCKFTTYDFTLNMDVLEHKTKKMISSTMIWQTPPSYLSFYKDFKKVEISEGKIIILDFLDKPHFEIETASLTTCCPIVNYIYGNKIDEPELIKKLRYNDGQV